MHFKTCDGTYTETFDRLERDGIISTRGLKPDAKVMDEMVFDVNSAYFESGGGYDYAKDFFSDVYRLAVREPPKFIKKIGKTTYEVTVHFSQTSKETMADKIMRLTKNEVLYHNDINSL